MFNQNERLPLKQSLRIVTTWPILVFAAASRFRVWSKNRAAAVTFVRRFVWPRALYRISPVDSSRLRRRATGAAKSAGQSHLAAEINRAHLLRLNSIHEHTHTAGENRDDNNITFAVDVCDRHLFSMILFFNDIFKDYCSQYRHFKNNYLF